MKYFKEIGFKEKTDLSLAISLKDFIRIPNDLELSDSQVDGCKRYFIHHEKSDWHDARIPVNYSSNSFLVTVGFQKVGVNAYNCGI